MNTECTSHIRILAGLRYNTISEQNLILLLEKYALNDCEAQEVMQYCAEHQIHIIDETEEMPPAKTPSPKSSRESTSPVTSLSEDHLIAEQEREEMKEIKILSKIVADWITDMKESLIQKGYYSTIRCGFYANKIIEQLPYKVSRLFSIDELRFIVSHLPEKSGQETCFMLQNEQDRIVYEAIMKKLYGLIMKNISREKPRRYKL